MRVVPASDIDYDIHGWLRLRLVDAPAAAAEFAARELNPLVPQASTGKPDVSLITTPERLVRSACHQLGNAGDFQECMFSESEFWLLHGSGAVSIPFDEIANGCEIRYTPGLSPRRLFSHVRPVLHLSLLDKQAAAVHSAAALFRGKGIMFAGWAESGKTELMLAFVQQGASFISDKWSILPADGSSVHGFPSPLTIRPWLVKRMPWLANNLGRKEVLKLRLASVISGAATRTIKGRQSTLLGEFVNLTRAALDPLIRVSIPARRLLGGNATASTAGSISQSAPLDMVFFLLTGNQKDISVQPADPEDVAHRMAECASFERRAFIGAYTKFKFASPQRRSTVVEESRELEKALIAGALRAKQVFLVNLPFPFDPLEAYMALERFC